MVEATIDLLNCNKMNNCNSTLSNYDIKCAIKHCKSAIIKTLKAQKGQLKRETKEEKKQMSVKDWVKSKEVRIKRIDQVLKSNLDNPKQTIKAIASIS